MEKQVFISLYLDTRRPKQNGNCPVKLRVFTPTPRKQKLYNTVFEATQKDWAKMWTGANPPAKYASLVEDMNEGLKRARAIQKQIQPFDFHQFEKLLFTSSGEESKIKFHYQSTQRELDKAGQLGTSSSYGLAFKSLLAYANDLRAESGGKEITDIAFNAITPKWLQGYEDYMTSERTEVDGKKTKTIPAKSATTVGIYLRTLRAVFNTAIANKDIKAELYPFGSSKQKKYEIPTGRKVKKSLDEKSLSKLFNAKAGTPQQDKARAFFFLSYGSNGMNTKDIALLKGANMTPETINFVRAKTKRSKKEATTITVYRTDFINSVIEKYGNPDAGKKDFIFDIVSQHDTPAQQHNKVKNFTKFVNQHLKILAEKNGITEEISTYWARHSFSTQAIRTGASMELVSEALGHGSLKTTQGYFGGFEDSRKRELANKLMNFSGGDEK